MFRIGYNTNGLAHHRVLDALRLVAELGYEAVAITPDVCGLDPFHLVREEVQDTRRWAEDLGLELSIETGARYLLDARRKHYPTLLEDDAAARARRVDFLVRSVELAHELGASVVSLWSGRAPSGIVCEDPRAAVGEREAVLDRLASGLEVVLGHAREAGVQVAFEPEPGMFIERPSGYGDLVARMGAAADELGLCLDVGHLLVTGDLPVAKLVREWAPRLVHVHLDDIAGGVHEHCMFGMGELDLPETLGALIDIEFDGQAAVELSRDSHRGPEAAAEALAHVRTALTPR
ncbi:MAG: sugar phosphate isomerase/epimerase [bacterium]|nr:sugar phosphate isomerase/epimerase [bacterium]